MSNKPNLRKTTVMLPVELIEKATSASGEGITPTIRKGLELVAAKAAYEGLRNSRGTYKSSINLDELREDK